MANSKLEQLRKERLLTQARQPKVVERMCRITLAADYHRSEEITWCEGLGKPTNYYLLEPGKSLVWPLTKAEAYFGPFQWFKVLEQSTDERELRAVEERISTEMARYLNRYDYPRGNGRGESPDMNPVGPHRSPDATIEILAPNGGVEQTCRLYELYGIGEFDTWVFDKKPTEAEIKQYYEEKLAKEREEREQERREFQERMAKLEGMMEGVVSVVAHPSETAKKGNGGKKDLVEA